MTVRWEDPHATSTGEGACWEMFHENSKTTEFDARPGEQQAAAWRAALSPALSFDLCPATRLPERAASVDTSLTRAIAERATPDRLERTELSMPQLVTLLHSAYGVTRTGAGSGRVARSVPSAGGLYPLEILLHTRSVDGLEPGLYHYNPLRHELRRLRSGDQTARIASALVQRAFAVEASVVFFVAAFFSRTAARFGERGYRYALLEAGHVGQNLALAATGLGLACIPVGEYLDRRVDDLLGFDGLSQSVVYMAALGAVPADVSPGAAAR